VSDLINKDNDEWYGYHSFFFGRERLS